MAVEVFSETSTNIHRETFNIWYKKIKEKKETLIKMNLTINNKKIAFARFVHTITE